MAEPLSLRFAKNVENNRKRLIDFNNRNGRATQNTASLDAVVDNLVIEDFEGVVYPVRFIDVDGKEFSPTQYLKPGESIDWSVVEAPNYDPEYLEFVDYASDAWDIDNIDYETTVMPNYVAKPDSDGNRWTVLKCEFTADTGLSPSMSLYRTVTGQTFWVDWGDGVVEEFISTTSRTAATHTYSTEGSYVIKIRSDNVWYHEESGGRFMLGTSSKLNSAITHCYLGDSLYRVHNYMCYAMENCRVLVVGALTQSSLTVNENCFARLNKVPVMNLSLLIDAYFAYLCTYANCLLYMILPQKITSMHGFTYSYRLKYLTLPQTLTTITGPLNVCYSLTKIRGENVKTCTGNYISQTLQDDASLIHMPFPNLETVAAMDAFYQACTSLKNAIIVKGASVGKGAFSSCYSLEDLKIPKDFDYSLYLDSCYNLTKSSLLHIASQLKDNSDTVAKILSVNNGLSHLLENTYVNQQGIEATEGDEDVISLQTYIQNKNWTITLTGLK